MTDLRSQVEQLLAGPRPLPIVTAGTAVLRQRAEQYDGQLEEGMLTQLIEAMRQTMYAAPGVGLAAPQVGLGVSLAVLEDSAEIPAEIAEPRERAALPFTVLINPTVTPVGNRSALFYEGCLSVPGYSAAVERAADVTVSFTDLAGTIVEADYSGWAARIVQHEVDHLNGTLYLDRALIRSFSDLPNYQTHWAGASGERARAGLQF
jgi:peptide deformylase